MQASSKQAQDQLAALKADLAAQIALNKKMAGQVKEKDSRIRALEAELEALRAKNGNLCTECGYMYNYVMKCLFHASRMNSHMVCVSGDSAALLAQLEDAKAHSAALSQQVAAESAAREAAIAESLATAQRAQVTIVTCQHSSVARMCSTPQLLQEQVDALNRTAAEAVKRLHENLDGAEANRIVRTYYRCLESYDSLPSSLAIERQRNDNTSEGEGDRVAGSKPEVRASGDERPASTTVGCDGRKEES